MGLRDTAEQLDACKAQSVRDEARIADLEQQLAATARPTRDQILDVLRIRRANLLDDDTAADLILALTTSR